MLMLEDSFWKSVFFCHTDLRVGTKVIRFASKCLFHLPLNYFDHCVFRNFLPFSKFCQPPIQGQDLYGLEAHLRTGGQKDQGDIRMNDTSDSTCSKHTASLPGPGLRFQGSSLHRDVPDGGPRREGGSAICRLRFPFPSVSEPL